MYKLYSYWRSSAAFRVRIGLALKGVSFETIPVHLVKSGGEQYSEGFLKLNPSGRVPVFADGDLLLTQSQAILEYLDEEHPAPPLLPKAAAQRAIVRGLVQEVTNDIHPLNNLRVMDYLRKELHCSEVNVTDWYAHWIIMGFDGLEKKLRKTAGEFCFGDSLTMADICLVPQVYNARRFDVALDAFPNIVRINENCIQLEAFRVASPANQPDAEH